MIINRYAEIIFIHIPKCAGTSLRTAFEENHNSEYVFKTKNIDDDSILRSLSQNTKHETYGEFLLNFTARTGYPISIISNYKFVAFSRNPYERFCSLHSYLLETHRNKYPKIPENINEFANQLYHGREEYLEKIRSLKTQKSYIEGISEDRLILGRVENIEDDYSRIALKLGITSQLKAINRSNNTTKSLRKLTNRSREILQKKYADDFEYFLYAL